MSKDITFDDILKMGAEKGTDLLRGMIGRELKDHDRRLRALASIRVCDPERSKVVDLIRLLEYDKGRK